MNSENDEVVDENLQNLSLWDIVKLNNAEMPQIFLGCLASFVMGATMPIFAILFGEIIGVCSNSFNCNFFYSHINFPDSRR